MRCVNGALVKCEFMDSLKLSNIVHADIKRTLLRKKITELLVYYYQTSLKRWCTNNVINIEQLYEYFILITYCVVFTRKRNKGQKLSLHVVTGLMLLRVFFPRDILGLLLLNIFANGIFLFIEKSDICN